ncbi:uncharacterized protein LOC105849176 isoform X1 [Hydra vulgaris]|uniref:uncharacterized protein LOC105849176 isoform X1 n=2 Tax=Hydra vulgaris TaxID=6087 RepID=UPI0032E9DCA2
MDPKIKSILIDNMSSEWKKFAHGTGINPVIIDYVDLDEGTSEEKMETFLSELIKRYSSNFFPMVEKSLKELGSIRVLKEIQTFYEIARLKLHYVSIYDATMQQTNQDIQTHNSVNLFTSHFNLAEMDDSYCEIDNEWEDFVKKQNSYKKVTFNDVFSQAHPLLLVSGIAGIGKTYFLKKCLLLWANGIIWKDIDFVFYFDFNKINELQNISSINELIQRFYGNILKGPEISSKWAITIVMDGLDQFAHLKKLIHHKLNEPSDIPLLVTLKHVLSSRQMKCVLAGRVKAMALYRSVYNDKDDITNIQVMGYSNIGMKFYTENNLTSTNLINDLNEVFASSFEAKALFSVPLYLKAVCKTLLNLVIVSVTTLTEILTLIFYYFLQMKNKSKPLYKLMHTNYLLMLETCRTAFNLLENCNVSISFEEKTHNLDLMKINLLEMLNIIQRYEFSHFILLKYCASVHIYLCESPQIVLNNERLHTCLPIVTGLEFGKDKSFLSLISNLKMPVYKKKLWLQEVLEYGDRKLFIQCLYESKTSFNNDLKVSIDVLNKWSQSNHDGSAEVIAEKYFIKKITEFRKYLYSEKLEYNDLKMRVEKTMSEAMGSYERKQFDNAKLILTEVENMQKEILGEKHVDTLTTKYWIAMCLYYKKHFDEAEKIFREVNIMQKEVLGDDHENTLKTKHGIAKCLYDKKEFNGAEQLYIEVENMQKAVLGEKHIDTLSTKYWVARCLYNKNQFNEAENLLRELETIRKEVLGDEHADTLNSKYWIARCLHDKKQFDETERLLKEIETIQNKVLGENHLDTINTKYWIARCLYNKKLLDDAEKLFTEVEKLQKEVLEENHEDQLSTKYWIARCLYEKKQFDDAENLLRDVYNMRMKHLGDKHVDTLNSKYWIGRCLYNKKKFHDAENLLIEVEKFQKIVLCSKHEETMDTKFWIARCYFENNQFDIAEILLREVENTLKEVFENKNEEILNIEHWIALCLYCTKQFDNAEKLFTDVENMRKESLGEKHVDTLKSKFWIARCFYDKKQFNDAEKIFQEVKNMQEEILGIKDAETLIDKYWIARCLFDKKQINNAEILFKETENLQKEVLGDEHADTVNSKYWIARCLYEEKQFDAAEILLKEVETVQNKVLGMKHVNSLTTKYWIARSIYNKKQFEEAEKLFSDLENMQNETLGVKHVDTLNTKYWIARCLYDRSQFDDAEKLLKEVEIMQEEFLGKENANTLYTKYWIAKCIDEKRFK